METKKPGDEIVFLSDDTDHLTGSVTLCKRKGYRYLWQFYAMLIKQRRICKKTGIKLRFTIDLP